MKKEIKIIGKSLQIKKLLEFIKRAGETNANVLILGETGVGKDLAARMIHSLSERRNGPFIKANCANINENLLESELFGHTKGAFTGAFRDKIGLLEVANGGTFFLDEIADITPCLQAKLLSVIEEKEFRRLGENKTKKIDVRFIFASNKDFFELIRKKNLREDLYYRISTLKFYIPPLRERKEDISLLIKNILKTLNKEKVNKAIHERALMKLYNYNYPGNIRELENIIKRAHALSYGDIIEEKHIELDIEIKTEQLSISEELYENMVKGKKNFWDVVHKPFLQRELKRDEVKKIIALGFKQANGSYKKILPLFNIEQNEKNYKRFMKIIKIHRLNIDQL